MGGHFEKSRRRFLKGGVALAALGGAYAVEKRAALSNALVDILLQVDNNLEIRPKRENLQMEIFPGITYDRDVMEDPRALMVHTVSVDLSYPGISFFVSPGDASAGREIRAMTTTDFLTQYHDTGLAVAVNANFFTPFNARTPLTYYPQVGDSVDLQGLAISAGVQYSDPEQDQPVLCLLPNSAQMSDMDCPPGTENAISGNTTLVSKGEIVVEDDRVLHPRTAVGVGGNNLILMVVDGRQRKYSMGVTMPELARLMIEKGAQDAMNMDGGGSSEIAVLIEDEVRVLNSPIHTSIWGRERPVGNHVGVRVGK